MMNKKSKKKNEFFSIKEVIILLVITCFVNLFVFLLINKDDEKEKIVLDDNILQIIESYNYINNNYFEDVDKMELVNGAIKGMTDSLDDYSAFITDDESDTYNITLRGEYVGVGVQISELTDGRVIISGIIPNSPASNSDLKEGDILKNINGINLEDKSTKEISNYIKNGSDSEFNITVSRNDKEIKTKINRGKIELESIYSEIIEKENKKIGYIYINLFALNTDKQFKKALDDMEKSNINSLIIDLRDNSGGHLISAQNIISEFLDDTHVIYQVGKKDEYEKIYSTGKETKKYPIAVLVNSTSASGSEILAAALQEEYGASIVGTQTFGKGTVQEMLDITVTDNSYKLTVQKWLTPKGVWINKTGITPNYIVELKEEYYKNPTDENDNQLQKAISILLEK